MTKRLFKVESTDRSNIQLTRYFRRKRDAKEYLWEFGPMTSMRLRRGPAHKRGETGASRTLGRHTIMKSYSDVWYVAWHGIGSPSWYAEEPVLCPDGRLVSRTTMERAEGVNSPGMAPEVRPMYVLDTEGGPPVQLSVSPAMLRVDLSTAEAVDGLRRLIRPIDEESS